MMIFIIYSLARRLVLQSVVARRIYLHASCYSRQVRRNHKRKMVVDFSW